MSRTITMLLAPSASNSAPFDDLLDVHLVAAREPRQRRRDPMRRPLPALAVGILAEQLELPADEVAKLIAGRLVCRYRALVMSCSRSSPLNGVDALIRQSIAWARRVRAHVPSPRNPSCSWSDSPATSAAASRPSRRCSPSAARRSSTPTCWRGAPSSSARRASRRSSPAGERTSSRPDGHLDRAALRRVVFADHEQLEELNQIVHPEVERLRARLRGAGAEARRPLGGLRHSAALRAAHDGPVRSDHSRRRAPRACGSSGS